MFSIYIIKNKLNDKVYVGRTSYAIEHRFRNHTYASKRTRKITPLAVAMRNLGVENFWVELLEQHEDQKIAREREMYWVETLKPEYNANQGGSGGETRVPQEERDKVVELYIQMRDAKGVAEYLGTMSSHTAIRILREAGVEIVRRFDYNKKRVRIIELDKTFDSIREAAQFMLDEGYATGTLKTTEGGIIKQLGGRRHQYVGFHFERL